MDEVRPSKAILLKKPLDQSFTRVFFKNDRNGLENNYKQTLTRGVLVRPDP